MQTSQEKPRDTTRESHLSFGRSSRIVHAAADVEGACVSPA